MYSESSKTEESNHFRGIIILAVLILSVLLIGSCATSTKSSLAADGSDTGGVQIFYNPPEGRQYQELGLVTAQTGQTIAHDRSADWLISRMAEDAATMGADAIIIRSIQEGKWGLKGGGHTGFDRGKGEAIAIKFTDSSESKSE